MTTRTAFIVATAVGLLSLSAAQPAQAERGDSAEVTAFLLKNCNLDPAQAKVTKRYDGTWVVELSPTISPDQKKCAMNTFANYKVPIQYR